TADNDQPDERPTMPLPTPEQRAELDQINATIAELKRQAQTWTPVRVASLVGHRPLVVPADVLALRERIARLERGRPKPLGLPVMVELPREQRRPTFLMQKGNHLAPGERVEPGVPAALHPLPAGATP